MLALNKVEDTLSIVNNVLFAKPAIGNPAHTTVTYIGGVTTTIECTVDVFMNSLIIPSQSNNPHH